MSKPWAPAHNHSLCEHEYDEQSLASCEVHDSIATLLAMLLGKGFYSVAGRVVTLSNRLAIGDVQGGISAALKKVGFSSGTHVLVISLDDFRSTLQALDAAWLRLKDDRSGEAFRGRGERSGS